VNPDGISPIDLASTDICAAPGDTSNPLCNFEYTGYRVPLIVISPFAKKNYVSHTVADYTAILKFIEARYGLPSLTQRDAAQMDMSEFFDFTTIPWATPPSSIPQQVTAGACDSTKLQ
jgi:phospholipase C